MNMPGRKRVIQQYLKEPGGAGKTRAAKRTALASGLSGALPGALPRVTSGVSRPGQRSVVHNPTDRPALLSNTRQSRVANESSEIRAQAIF